MMTILMMVTIMLILREHTTLPLNTYCQNQSCNLYGKVLQIKGRVNVAMGATSTQFVKSFVEVVQINTGQNVVYVAVLFPLILHDYAEVVRTNTAQSVLFVVEPFQKKSEGFAVGVRANIKLAAVNAART